MIHLRKKHFEFLADAMRKARQRAAQDVSPDAVVGVDQAALALAENLVATSPTFDPARFLNACQFGQLALPFKEK